MEELPGALVFVFYHYVIRMLVTWKLQYGFKFFYVSTLLHTTIITYRCSYQYFIVHNTRAISSNSHINYLKVHKLISNTSPLSRNTYLDILRVSYEGRA